MSIYKNILFASLFLLGFSAFSQEKELGTEVVEIVKPYSPELSDAFKAKEVPNLTDSIAMEKRPIKYEINSVPVASTFTPEKGKAAQVEKAKREKLYNSYATLGLGNYTSVLGEFFTNFEISNEEEASLFFKHNSAEGKLDDILVENKYYDTRLDANYTNRNRDLSYGLDFGLEHQLYNWYGIPQQVFPIEQIAHIDPRQNYFSVNIGGNIAPKDSFFERGKANLRYTGDSHSSSEFNVLFKPEFVFPLEEISIKLGGDFDYLAGSFKRDFLNESGISYGFLKAGLIPSLSYQNEELAVSLGIGVYLGMNTEANTSNFAMYPKINASYRLDEAVILYAGVEGGPRKNTYYDFKEENPFISPTLTIKPSRNIYEAFGGIKGLFENVFGYNFRASYGKTENKALFQANPFKPFSSGFEGYEYHNSFNVIYDDVDVLSVFGEVKLTLSERFSIGVNANYFNYSLTEEAQAWNLPDFKASLFSDFNITKELYGGASIFFVGERNDLIQKSGTPMEMTLDAYVDANLHLGYRFNDRLSIFAKGNNLFGEQYQKWMNFPVYGIQGMLGATYKFDL